MKPACMSDPEYASWTEANERILNRESRADSPCRDCTATFHWEMRAAGSCDGTPGRLGRAPKPPEKSRDEWRTYWRVRKATERARVTA